MHFLIELIILYFNCYSIIQNYLNTGQKEILKCELLSYAYLGDMHYENM